MRVSYTVTVRNSHCAGKLVLTCAYDNKGFDMFTIVAFDISAKITSTFANLAIGLLTSTPPKNCTVVHFEVDRDPTLVWLFNWTKATESILTKPSRICWKAPVEKWPVWSIEAPLSLAKWIEFVVPVSTCHN